MKDVILTPTQRPYDIQEDTRVPVNVRAGIALENYRRAVSMAKKLGAV